MTDKWFSLLAGVVCAVAGAAAAWGFDALSDAFSEDPLKAIVENMSELNNHMRSDNANIAALIKELSKTRGDDAAVNALTEKINAGLESIQNSAAVLVQESSVLADAGQSIRERAITPLSNPNADLFLPTGRGTSLCNRENTFAVQAKFPTVVKAALKGKTKNMSVGYEWQFDVTADTKGMVSYLGSSNDTHEFRVVCQ